MNSLIDYVRNLIEKSHLFYGLDLSSSFHLLFMFPEQEFVMLSTR